MSVPVVEKMMDPMVPAVALVWLGSGVDAVSQAAALKDAARSGTVWVTGDMRVFAAWLRDVVASRQPTRVVLCPGDGTSPLSGDVRALLAVLRVQDGGRRHMVVWHG